MFDSSIFHLISILGCVCDFGEDGRHQGSTLPTREHEHRIEVLAHPDEASMENLLRC